MIAGMGCMLKVTGIRSAMAMVGPRPGIAPMTIPAVIPLMAAITTQMSSNA